MMDWRHELGQMLGERRFRSLGRNLLLASTVGAVSGIGAVLFHLMGETVTHFVLTKLAGYDPGGPAGEAGYFGKLSVTLHPWLILPIITAGGLVSGWLIYTFAPEAEGHGTDAAIDAYHNRRGVIRPRVPIIKIIASAFTLGTGGSGGREGPIAQIGAGFGSFLAQKLKLNDHERRTLLAAGVGAGIGSIFHAPLAGAIFAIEVLYSGADFEAEALIPAFISTTIAYCVFNVVITLGANCFGYQFNGFSHLFQVSADIRFRDPRLLMPLTAMVVVMIVASAAYVKMFYGLHGLFKKLPIPNTFKPAIGALSTGLVAVGGYYSMSHFGSTAQHDTLGVLGFGYGFLQKLLSAHHSGVDLSIVVLLVVAVGKMLTTSLTIGSGGSAGVFGPSVVIGGSLGAIVGLIFQRITPGVVGRIDVFVILGMASFFAAAAKTPVSALMMVSEMTGSYELLLPAMWVCALAYVFSRGWTIYREQVPTRLDSAAHRGEFAIDLLQGLTVKDALGEGDSEFTTFPLDMPLRQIVRQIVDANHSCFPVVDASGQYVGLFSLNDVRPFLYDTSISDLAVAIDLATVDDLALPIDLDLGSAIGQFVSHRFDELPVVAADQPKKVIAMLRRQDVIAAYNTRLLKLRAENGNKRDED